MKSKVIYYFIFAIIIGFMITIIIARYQVKQNATQASYELGMGDVKQIASVMKREGKIVPLYQIYLKNDFLQRYVSYFNKRKHNEAVYWDSFPKRIIVPEDKFNELCSYVIEENGNNVLIYDKYNNKVRIEFCISKKRTEPFSTSD